MGLTSEQQALAKLRKENQQLRMERAILKKAAAFFSQRVKLRYQFIKTQQKAFPIRTLCKVIQVSRSGYYSYLDVVCLQRRRYVITTQGKRGLPVAENQLNRQFNVDAPNRVWIVDITYLSTREGQAYTH